MGEYLKSLQERYGYTNKLIELLRKIILAFIEHYGKEYETLILDAIASCEIHIKEENEKNNEYVRGFFSEKKIKPIPAVVPAFYDSMPIITDQQIDSKRLIYINSESLIDPQEESTISNLVHEIGHLIKSFNKEYSIVNGKIQQRSGISTTTVVKDQETGKYVEGKCENAGIEEAINCYDEQRVMSLILGRKFTNPSYFGWFNRAIEPLFENQELVTAFRRAQIYDTDEHIKLLGKEGFKTLSDYFENIYSILLNPLVAKKRSGGKKAPQLLNEETEKIFEYARQYREQKERNFSLEAVEELDYNVGYDEREGRNSRVD